MKQKRPEPSEQDLAETLFQTVRTQKAPAGSPAWRETPQSVRDAAAAASLEDFTDRAVEALRERGRK